MEDSCQSSKHCVLLAICFFLLLDNSSFVADAHGDTKVYIIYMGERRRDDPEFVTTSHHQMLESFLGSKEEALKSIVYSFRHGFSGFAAELTPSQAMEISEHEEVVHVIPSRIHKIKTTRTWDLLGLSPSPTSPKALLHDTNFGSEAIIGVIDTESPVYNDKGLGPIPKRWRGHCVSGESFNGGVHCNKKLIGAKYYIDALIRQIGGHYNRTEVPDFLSPRDTNGHGTHVSAIAGGSFVPKVSYFGLARGTLRGGAPRARIAMYKACWNVMGDSGDAVGKCTTADIWKAFDDAIHDGVDVLSVSLGGSVPLDGEVDQLDNVAAFHAVKKGIPVVCAAGNDGPNAQTVVNVAPWVLTVAATTLDRSFPTAIALGNNQTIFGEALHTGREFSAGLIHIADAEDRKVDVKGKMALIFDTEDTKNLIPLARLGGASGLILAQMANDVLTQCPADFPCIFVDYELGTDILFYIRSARSPTVRISPSKTLVGRPATTKVAAFSCRGPNSISPAILKPDIAAPGVGILSALSPDNDKADNGFGMETGTSMSTPVISGIAALLKALHPRWSPAAIRSAMVTTAWRTSPSGEPIFAEGSSKKLADPFDYGGGLVNPEKAAKPGLVYDMFMSDYVHYLCSTGYNDSSISNVVGETVTCPTDRKPSILDVNLPSITIPDIKDEVLVRRTVTNVGPVNSVYEAVIEPPLGINVEATPKKLVFDSRNKRVTFVVKISTRHEVNTGYLFGSLTWTDGVHDVRIPLSVRTRILKHYN
ncbi:PREDICTED: subtilisin-like protease SBT3.13 isoform X2 [Tarenaya hassleriana]|uniref:subtilisin-like protease SBT3.13 isoform X2 n=1 Tax=Tarenaya hassleriana TaxID=28532 RepID=UPI00053C2C68|nr:PREDICTED: subtilisin-like protease SBT3.13 isoform X2 [Tarenaya hassleriana]